MSVQKPEVVFFANSSAQAEDALSICKHLRRRTLLVATWPAVSDHVRSKVSGDQPQIKSLATNWPARIQKVLLIWRGRALVTSLTQQRPFPLFVFGCDMNQYETALIHFIQSRGAVSLLVQDGLLDSNSLGQIAESPRWATRVGLQVLRGAGIVPTFNPMYGAAGCDHIAIYGESTRDLLVKGGVASEKLQVTGAPRFDYLYASRPTGPATNSPLTILCLGIMVAPRYWGPPELDEKWIRALNDLAVQRPNWRVIVRPHPSESSQMYTEVFRKLNADALILERSSSIHDALLASDVVITHCVTTILVECLIASKPILFLDLQADFQRNDYMNAVVNVTDLAQLPLLIDEVITSQAAQANLAGARKEFLGQHHVFDDGSSGRRVAELIDSLNAN